MYHMASEGYGHLFSYRSPHTSGPSVNTIVHLTAAAWPTAAPLLHVTSDFGLTFPVSFGQQRPATGMQLATRMRRYWVGNKQQEARAAPVIVAVIFDIPSVALSTVLYTQPLLATVYRAIPDCRNIYAPELKATYFVKLTTHVQAAPTAVRSQTCNPLKSKEQTAVKHEVFHYTVQRRENQGLKCAGTGTSEKSLRQYRHFCQKSHYSNVEFHNTA